MVLFAQSLFFFVAVNNGENIWCNIDLLHLSEYDVVKYFS